MRGTAARGVCREIGDSLRIFKRCARAVMSANASVVYSTAGDPVSRVLKWILLAVGILTFALMAWASVVTYQTAPPQPARFIAAGGALIMSGDDILAGKAGFQKADLMDYGSLYGMGSYYGEDYTATTLVSLAEATENAVALSKYRQLFAALPPDQAAATQAEMQRELQSIDLTRQEVVLPDAVAAAIQGVRRDTASALSTTNVASGWTAAYTLHGHLALQTADFLVFSALTTVARRPGLGASWTQNWPYEPIVGNAPTPSTFIWTWASFCFTFLGAIY